MANPLLEKNPFGCPKLFLAPMEGVGSLPFRKAMSTIGGFDEACTEFLRVPANAHSPSLVKRYIYNQLSPFPQAVQLMGSNPNLMADMCVLLEKRKAPRIDLNCGCPSNTVTGRGAGSSLLKDPHLLFNVAKAMKQSVNIPVTAKLRSGFDDTSLFEENLLAAQEAGVDFITLHPRTKKQGYKPPADWSLIAKAKKLLSIPVVGNGDIYCVEDALKMLKETNCDALMIGRGSVINPWIFHEIKAAFSKKPFQKTFQSFENFLDCFIRTLPEDSRLKNKINHLKQLCGFLLDKTPFLRKEFLRKQFSSVDNMKDCILSLIRDNYL